MYNIENARHNNINTDIVRYKIYFKNGYYHYICYNKDSIGIVSGIATTYNDAVNQCK